MKALITYSRGWIILRASNVSTIFDDMGILMAFFKETIAFVQKLSIVVLGANMRAGLRHLIMAECNS